MALRSKAKPLSGVGYTGLLVSVGLFAQSIPAQINTYEVRHQHWHGGAVGTLRISPESISFEELGKNDTRDSRQWRYDEIQQLTLTPSELRILTYDDIKLKLGRDREYVFNRVPRSLPVEIYRLWAAKLDRRFVAGISNPELTPVWKIAAKLDHGLSGTLGTLMLGKEQIVFDAGERRGSRSWRLIDIENVSRTSALDLTLTTSEKSGWLRAGMRQFHFQLQRALPEDQFDSLWRRISSSQGLRLLEPESPDRSY